MIKRIILVLFIALSLTAQADHHTSIVGLSLDMQPEHLMKELTKRGLYQEDEQTLTGKLEGIDVLLRMYCSKDSSRVNSILLTTMKSLGGNQRETYSTLMKWMHKNYGAPTWESSVRSHPFARWYVQYDRDIVMVATGASTVEVWFYENHNQRNIDYYSILKYCERNPVDGVPHMTAQESITWKSKTPSQSFKKKAKGRSRKYIQKRKSRTKKGSRAKHRQRRRNR